MWHVQETSENNSSTSLYRLKNLIHNCSNNPNCILSVWRGASQCRSRHPRAGNVYNVTLRGWLEGTRGIQKAFSDQNQRTLHCLPLDRLLITLEKHTTGFWTLSSRGF